MMPVIVHIFLLLASTASVAHAQEYGVVDTVWMDRDSFPAVPTSIRAYNDTVVFTTTDEVEGSILWFSTDHGAMWSSQTSPRNAQSQLPGIGMHSAGRAFAGSTFGSHVWLYRGNSLVYSDSIGKPNKVPPYPVRWIIVHPLRPDITFLVCETGDQFSTLFPVYSRKADNAEWSLVDIPRSKLGQGQAVTLGFDFSKPDRIWISVNGSYYFDRELPDENYYTDDYGQSFHSVPNGHRANDPWRQLPSLIGMLKKDYGLYPVGEYVHGEYKVNGYHFYNPITGHTDSLPWKENIVRDLFPELDSSQSYISFVVQPLNNASFFVCNPQLPEQLRLAISIDTLINGQWKSTFAMVVTTDLGMNWKWLLRPAMTDTSSFPCATVDPISGTYYVTFITYAKAADTRGPIIGTGVMRISLPATSVVNNYSPPRSLRLTPHPVTESATISMPPEEFIQDLTMRDISGRIVFSQSFDDLNSTVTINTSGLPTGAYLLVVTTTNRVHRTPLTIAH